MSDTVQKYGVFVGLLVVVVLVYLARKTGGPSNGPGYSNITEGIDTGYEALKFDAEVKKAAIAASAYQTLADYETGQSKFATDVALANIEGGYMVQLKAQDVDLQKFQAGAARDVGLSATAAQERIAASQAAAAVQVAQVGANADIQTAKAQASAQKHSSFWGNLAGIATGVLSFL